MIEELDDYLPNKPRGKNYKDHVAVLRTWIRRALTNQPTDNILAAEEKEKRVSQNKKFAEFAEEKLRQQFTARVHFSAHPDMCLLTNSNKDVTKKYFYDKLEPKLFLMELLKDLENNFRDVRKLLKGDK